MSTKGRRPKGPVRYSGKPVEPSPGRREAGPTALRGGPHRRARSGARWAALALLAVAGLALIFFRNNSGGRAEGQAGEYEFQVGTPGPGAQAPPIRLPSTGGGMFDLASLRGQKVLLYFQEGLMCQPCWDQIVDIEAEMPRLRSLGVDQMVSITTDPADALRTKVKDEGIATPVLSDPGLGVSRIYNANRYGMMGMSMNGHTFILVDEDGVIRWRADYGGEPKNYMYVPVGNLVADLRAGSAGSGS